LGSNAAPGSGIRTPDYTSKGKAVVGQDSPLAEVFHNASIRSRRARGNNLKFERVGWADVKPSPGLARELYLLFNPEMV
jgi:hypothetical protein